MYICRLENIRHQYSESRRFDLTLKRTNEVNLHPGYPAPLTLAFVLLRYQKAKTIYKL